MLIATKEKLRSVLASDPTVNQNTLDDIISTAASASSDEGQRVISRAEARDRFFPGKSLRYLDKLGEEGLLRRVVLPGRQRSAGFTVADIRALITGGA